MIGRTGCQLLLMNDARYPWLILVPEHDDMQELHELAEASYVEVTQGIRQISEKLQTLMNATKMNIAALGNQVPNCTSILLLVGMKITLGQTCVGRWRRGAMTRRNSGY